MTICYPDGTVVNALLLSRGNDILRAAVPHDADVRTFTLRNGCWISENCEPVTLEFDWEHNQQAAIPEETECICSKPLARKLISMLFAGSEKDAAAENMVYVFSADGDRVRIQKSQLHVKSAHVGVIADRSEPLPLCATASHQS
jgi:hypothetical protein